MVKREVTFVPGMYKIFDEILLNVAGMQQQDPKMATIEINIKPKENTISVINNGKGIPVEMLTEENMYVPTFNFGHLSSGGDLSTNSNCDKHEAEETFQQNWFGAKLCNIFSKKFTVETADNMKTFRQTWSSNMSVTSEPMVEDLPGEEFTKVTFQPSLTRFGLSRLDPDLVAIISRRAFDIAATLRGVEEVYLNGKKIPINSFKDYVDLFTKNELDDAGNALEVIYDQCSDR